MKKYLNWIKQQPCAVCEDNSGSDPHHLKGLKLGMNCKCDLLVIPLCRKHHDSFHNDPGLWETVHDAQLTYLARTLIRAEYQGWQLVEISS